MKRLVELVVTAAMLTIPAAASAQTLTEAQARVAIAPWYQLFNQPVQGDMKTLQEQILTADYDSCWGYLPGECWGRETSIKVVGGFAVALAPRAFRVRVWQITSWGRGSRTGRPRRRRSGPQGIPVQFSDSHSIPTSISSEFPRIDVSGRALGKDEKDPAIQTTSTAKLRRVDFGGCGPLQPEK